MKGKIAILALVTLFSFSAVSISFADNAKTKDTSKISCKKQAKKMKFKDKKERTIFMKTCKKSKTKKEKIKK